MKTTKKNDENYCNGQRFKNFVVQLSTTEVHRSVVGKMPLFFFFVFEKVVIFFLTDFFFVLATFWFDGRYNFFWFLYFFVFIDLIFRRF